jgi:SnoaL-like domain
MEDKKITQIIIAIFSCADNHQWLQIESLMNTSVLLDYTSFIGGIPEVFAPKQITDNWANFLPGFDRTHHQLSDFQVSIDGNFAHISYIGRADHYIHTDVWTVEGTYESELHCIEGKWLVSKLKFNFEKQSGNFELAVIATSRMKK